MPCTPNNIPLDPSCVNQTLSIDETTGDLTISNGNTVILADIVKLLETQTVLSSVTLTGTILQIVYIGEDGVPQAKNVDLASLITSGSINIEDSNSIALSFDGTKLRADLIIDPASTAPISASAAGLNIGCCNDIPITTNVTNTIQLLASGPSGHVLTANLKYQDSPSIDFSDGSTGVTALVKLSTDTGNATIFGSDGAIYTPSAGSQLGSLPLNGYITTGPTGTIIVGADSKGYRVPDPIPQDPITPIDTNTVNLTVNGINNHTIQADVNINSTNTVQLTSTPGGIQADLKVNNLTPGNITITSNTNGVIANIDCNAVKSLLSNQASVQNPIIKSYGTLNNGDCGYADVFISQYGIKIPSFTSTGRVSIPTADLYNSLLVFDTTIGAFFWYDAINSIWVQIGSSGGSGGSGITSINGLTVTSQNLIIGTAGTNFNIVSSGSDHIFNIPISDSTNTGLLSNTDWTTFNNKLSTADNGLTVTGTNIEFGGTLLHDTNVSAGSFQTLFDGANTSDAIFKATNSSSGFGLSGVSTNLSGIGVYAANLSGGIALQAETIAGISMRVSTASGLPLYLINQPSSTNTITPLLELHRSTSGTAAAGLAGSIDFYNSTTSSSEALSNQLISRWTNATLATRTSEFIITGVNSALTADLLTISGNGATKLNKYGSGTFTGTPTFIIATDSAGNLIETSLSGAGAFTATQFMWVVGGGSNFTSLPGSPTPPMAGATTLVNSILTGKNVRMFRNGIAQLGFNPANGNTYYTKTTGSNTVTFPALVNGEEIIIETIAT